MYRIDWTKYLIEERLRNSKSNVCTQTAIDNLDYRNPFESDLGRVVFCSASRRMHDKTQVFPLTNGDSVHTRLTHSIEVMTIAADLGSNLCRDKEFIKLYGSQEAYELERKIVAILKTVAFVHDIGNPPFGHYGEKTIQKYFKNKFNDKKFNYKIEEKQKLDFVEFDGNAEGFRILTKLQYLGDLYGLNLTCATLAAYLKYPNIGKIAQDQTSEYEQNISKHKHGVFTSESDIFNAIIEKCNLRVSEDKIKRHPLAFLMEAADTICYRAMDIEDAFKLGWISLNDIKDFASEKAQKMGLSDYDIFKKLDYTEDPKSQKKSQVNFRVKLIAYYMKLAIGNFINNLESIDKGEYNKELIEDDVNKVDEILNDFEKQYILCRKEIEKVELTGAAVLIGIFDIVFRLLNEKEGRLKSIISNTNISLVYNEAKDENMPINEIDLGELDSYSQIRIVVDWISGMTDNYAYETFQRLSGMIL